MKKGDILRVHDAVRITHGANRGVVGTVVDLAENKASVIAEGVQDGRALNVDRWFSLSHLGRNDGRKA